MHGIIRQRQINNQNSSVFRLNQIVVRYGDGRTLTFVPEAGRENFSEDDMHELVKVLQRASSVAEWAEVSENPNIKGY
ncbi:hypothetical protein GBA65_11625 [Rubrobacter marinus]|uniref:Uncharacterized protein n=1 Tax=Rubrobacter marinus TaxID=2653852 RepID=A0A6G8PXX7_9ACTN|nr:hypothetical protein [Rubrobacter marinus]QIN79063.1 hypothetical protein GBA65_11625 [Rubrobacter marinus]